MLSYVEDLPTASVNVFVNALLPSSESGCLCFCQPGGHEPSSVPEVPQPADERCYLPAGRGYSGEMGHEMLHNFHGLPLHDKE